MERKLVTYVKVLIAVVLLFIIATTVSSALQLEALNAVLTSTP